MREANLYMTHYSVSSQIPLLFKSTIVQCHRFKAHPLDIRVLSAEHNT